MSKPPMKNLIRSHDLREQFDYAGQRVACYGNVDQEDVFIVDPVTLEKVGSPKMDVEYPMLRLGVNNMTCKFYENATVTQAVDRQLREHGIMEGQRDWYDVTLLVRTDARAENVHNILGRARPKHTASMECEGPKVVSLFNREPVMH